MLDITLQTLHHGYDRKTCWVHARPGVIPGDRPTFIVTLQKLRLSGSDVFYALHDLRSDDGGRTWTGPTEHADTLGRRPIAGGMEQAVCDFWPTWHAQSGVLLGTGHTVTYLRDDHPPQHTPISTAYSVYDPQRRAWAPWAKLEMPDAEKFYMSGAGCTQRVDLPNGEILLPVYFSPLQTFKGTFEYLGVATVLRCTFDGTTLRYVEHGSEMTLPTGRGFAEPSLAQAGGRYYLTLRNDDRGYITSGHDGLHFGEPRPWTFDDGAELGNYNTQQHWVTHGNDLYLVYTRRGANNDHVFRHRAPLFIAQVDPERLCVRRHTEQILVPQRGARLGNFGVARVNEHESWVTVSEWMQTNPPDPFDCRVCEKYGSDNSVFAAKIRF
jgi:hypothetical protein